MTDNLATDNHAVAARFHRLHGICERIKWTDVGVPAVDEPGTRSALEDLSEYLFMAGINDALARGSSAAAPGSTPSSSSGRTPAFDAANPGSNPGEGTNLVSEEPVYGVAASFVIIDELGSAPEPGVQPDANEPFQARVRPWMKACFGEQISADRLERGDRLLEEALELLQSGGYPRERIAALTDYVYERPAGEPAQEVGGVMVTLAAYCLAHGLDMHADGERELARVWTKVDAIRAKQAAKPTGSALPIAVDPEPRPGSRASRPATSALGAGVKAVPILPTQEMLDAGYWPCVQRRGAKSVWGEMLKAAPVLTPGPTADSVADHLCDATPVVSHESGSVKHKPADTAVPDATLVEQVAQWLHDEVEYPEYPYPHFSWPAHPGDTGQRGDGWLKIVPKDVQEQFRDIARRLVRGFIEKRGDNLIALQAECARLRAEIAAKDAALEAFADIADLIDSETEGLVDTDEFELLFCSNLMQVFKVGDFRAARAALKKEGRK